MKKTTKRLPSSEAELIAARAPRKRAPQVRSRAEIGNQAAWLLRNYLRFNVAEMPSARLVTFATAIHALEASKETGWWGAAGLPAITLLTLIAGPQKERPDNNDKLFHSSEVESLNELKELYEEDHCRPYGT